MQESTLTPEHEAQSIDIATSDVAATTPPEPSNEMTPILLTRPRTVRLHWSVITPNPFQPRKTFSESYIAGLAESIYQNGMLDEPLIRENPNEDGAYQLITGENRWRAVRMLELQGRGDGYFDLKPREADNRTMLELALLENIQRRNLNALEEAWGFVELEKMGLTQGEIGAKYGYSQPVVSNRIRLLDLPESVKDAIRDDNLSAGHGVALLALPKDDRLKWAMRAMEENIAVKPLEALIRTHKEEQQDAAQPRLLPEPETPRTEDGYVARKGEPLIDTTTLPAVQPRAAGMSDAELATFKGEKTEEAGEEESNDATTINETPEPQQLRETEAVEAPVKETTTDESASEPVAQAVEPAPSTAPTPSAPIASGTMIMAPIPASESAWLKEKGLTTGVALAHLRRFYTICESAPNLGRILEMDGLGGVLDYLEKLHTGGDN